ncbi:DUF4433 domain-containing protein [Vibrio splendidus]|uniref:type II toxin-antitoxin system toxin DNA ADP-ribosyl transferase DarT n=1 Tax=Vibrio splendidus TaxID=29497 RepID=UPI000C833346|nr:DUF4433 domain-containing protein [Vibrio splendidus]PMP02556.1 hypothetical protein BCS97_23445 [Vibrio splendidus]PMP23608.1 hypothetical protein BCS89_02730 [Vibrio splendidus]PMP30993.1 hypothetical protein BCS88_17745 [Vibrio splendidus]PMP37165.1 hypothetical protein BCS87_15710 [Vibrio splendidus]PMP42528.1 hypothetical protein BCS85_21195 [Vibrio splendidus]
MAVKVSHITHINNLDGILTEGCLWSDSKRIDLKLNSKNIGYNHIKERRLQHRVEVAAGGTIGEYVPFNFCPRSVMLYVIHQGHDDFHDGQDKIIHLISDTQTITTSNQSCFFTDIHADLAFAEQIDDFSRLDELDFKKIHTKYWQQFKEEKQAEFLAHKAVSWNCIRQIGVKTPELADKVKQIIANAQHQPDVLVKPEWYY